MSELETAREEINDIDRQMAELFEKRMEISAMIGEYKRKNSLPVRDAKRERELTEKNLTYIKKSSLRLLYIEFLNKLMELSRDCQSGTHYHGSDEK